MACGRARDLGQGFRREERDGTAGTALWRKRLRCGIGGRDGQEAALWNAAACRQEALHRIEAQPIADPRDQVRKLIFGPRLRVADLLGSQRFGHRGGEAQPVDPEAGIHLIHPLEEQGRDPSRVPHCASYTDVNHGSRTIYAHEFQPDSPGPHLGRCQLVAKPDQQPVEHPHDIGCEPDRLGQGHPHPEMQGIRLGSDGFSLGPERLIQTAKKFRAEPARQWCPGHSGQVGDLVQSEAGQTVGDRSFNPQRAHRHWAELREQPAFRDHASSTAGKCPGTAPGLGNGAFRGDPCPLEPRLEIGQKLDFTAKEMRHARNIDDQAVRSIFRRMWSVTAGPSAQTFKRPALADQISGPRGEDRTDGARIGQGHAAMEAGCARDAVEAMKMIRVRRPERQRERPLNGADPQADVARQPGEPDGQQPSCHSNSHHRFQLFLFCSY